MSLRAPPFVSSPLHTLLDIDDARLQRRTWYMLYINDARHQRCSTLHRVLILLCFFSALASKVHAHRKPASTPNAPLLMPLPCCRQTTLRAPRRVTGHCW